MGGERLADAVRVRDVQGLTVRRYGGDVLVGEGRQQVLREHSGRPGDQPDRAHSAALSLSGSHQALFSRYQRTVSARPLRKSLPGSYPSSSRILVQSTE